MKTIENNAILSQMNLEQLKRESSRSKQELENYPSKISTDLVITGTSILSAIATGIGAYVLRDQPNSMDYLQTLQGLSTVESFIGLGFAIKSVFNYFSFKQERENYQKIENYIQIKQDSKKREEEYKTKQAKEIQRLRTFHEHFSIFNTKKAKESPGYEIIQKPETA